jgi:hypothetical protein
LDLDPYSHFDIDSVTLSFDRVQTAGPPPAAGVPEPASWTLTIAGFALAGAALRRRMPVRTPTMGDST